MNSSNRKLTIATVMAFSLQLVLLLALAPSAYATTPPTCTVSGTDGTYTYTLTLNTTPACSNSGVPLGTPLTATATTNDPSVTAVSFYVYNPSNALTYSSGQVNPFTFGPNALNAPGTWIVVANYWDPASSVRAVYVVTFDINVQILVLNDLPLGTIAAAGVSLVGLVAVTRLSKTFSTAIPAK
jgi:hypothetical protein